MSGGKARWTGPSKKAAPIIASSEQYPQIIFIGRRFSLRSCREVLDISLFSTTLGHADLSRVVIPKRKIVGEILHNYGQIRRLNISVGISYRADVNVALSLIADILAANPRVLKDPVPQLGVTRLAESSVSIGVCPWVNVPDYDTAISELNKTILEVFSVRNIALALPQYEVRMLGGAAELASAQA